MQNAEGVLKRKIKSCFCSSKVQRSTFAGHTNRHGDQCDKKARSCSLVGHFEKEILPKEG